MATVDGVKSGNTSDVFSVIGGRQATGAKSATAEAENRFLTLLMTQMKNQDPLNPMENAEITAQLAQLNTANGIEKLNSTMSRLLDGYNEAQAMQAAGMIGKSVLVAGNNLPLTEGKAFAGASLTMAADSVTVSIRNESGKVVQTQQLGAQKAGTFYFGWDGKDAKGATLPDGKYTFTVDAVAGGKAVLSSPMQVGTVSAVVRQDKSFVLDLGAMGNVAFKDVQQIL